MQNQNFIRSIFNNFNRRAEQVVLLAVFGFIFLYQVFAAPGDFEMTFGVDGKATIPNLSGRTKAVAMHAKRLNLTTLMWRNAVNFSSKDFVS